MRMGVLVARGGVSVEELIWITWGIAVSVLELSGGMDISITIPGAMFNTDGDDEDGRPRTFLGYGRHD